MSRLVVDTDVVSFLFKNHPLAQLYDPELVGHSLVLSFMTVAGLNILAFYGTSAFAEVKKLGPDAMLSIPTPDHSLPLLYVMATRQSGEDITFPIEGVDGGSISMLTVQVG